MFESGEDCGERFAGTYVLGALEPDERAAADAHLLVCPSCRSRVRDLEIVPRALADLPLEEFLTDFSVTPDRIEGIARRAVERAANDGGRSGGA
ncbi:zf-HC2 domain-containing protein [Nocardiopsis lambiniae]|uniref:Zf-HC2 domain-containing protein n=1 Tax=Nocardiopsis lambiniae TaxID=3075539 RepID=A0ABU2MEP4_9ACTN|nr:zf-HC2 domain-containing protein [Nocardiopsis sp. DSM 44743]MDT0331159.1 zf-HC2 domain-containing protein [Nocardiopsis sp. DSM 44743]